MSLQQLKDDCGVHFTLTVNALCPKVKQALSMDFQFGVNKLPTKIEVDAGIHQCLTKAEETFGHPVRIRTFSDFGIGGATGMDWPLGEKVDTPADDDLEENNDDDEEWEEEDDDA